MILSEGSGLKLSSDKPSEVPGTRLDKNQLRTVSGTKTGIKLVRATCLIDISHHRFCERKQAVLLLCYFPNIPTEI